MTSGTKMSHDLNYSQSSIGLLFQIGRFVNDYLKVTHAAQEGQHQFWNQ